MSGTNRKTRTDWWPQRKLLTTNFFVTFTPSEWGHWTLSYAIFWGKEESLKSSNKKVLNWFSYFFINFCNRMNILNSNLIFDEMCVFSYVSERWVCESKANFKIAEIPNHWLLSPVYGASSTVFGLLFYPFRNVVFVDINVT